MWSNFERFIIRPAVAVTGAVVGAGFGSVVSPGIGTVVGAVYGATKAWESIPNIVQRTNGARDTRPVERPVVKVITPCQKGCLCTEDEAAALRENQHENCWALEGSCQRQKHVRCKCSETIHFPFDDRTKLVLQPQNNLEFPQFLDNKGIVRSELTDSCNTIAQVSNGINNELRRYRDNMRQSRDAFNIFTHSDTNSFAIKVKELDDIGLQMKREMCHQIKKLQLTYLSHIDLYQDYSIRTAISLLKGENTDIKNCHEGIMAKAKTLFQRNIETIMNREDMKNLYIISFKRIVTQYNSGIQEEIAIIFHKLPTFWGRYEGMGTSANSLNTKYELVSETIDEIQVNCVDRVVNLSSALEQDIQLDEYQRQMSYEEGQQVLSTSCVACQRDQSNLRFWPESCHMCSGGRCDRCAICMNHFT